MPKSSRNEQSSITLGVKCKYCGSSQTVKYGSYHNIQRRFCKNCQRKFADNDSPPNMRTPSVQIASALGMFYEGMSLNAIRTHLLQTFGSTISNSTIYEWIIKFSKMAVTAEHFYSKRQTRKVSGLLGHGPFWITNETVLQIEGENAFIWDVMDTWSRFLLTSYVTRTRTAKDIKSAFNSAMERNSEIPGLIITNRLRTYTEGIELAFGSDAMHVQTTGNIHPKANYIDIFFGPLRKRNKTLRSIKKIESANLIVNSWLVYYNFFRPNIGLGNAIPAHKAGIEFPYRTWLDIVEKEYM